MLWLSLPARAEHPVTRLFTTEDGLVRNWVRRIHSDSRGRLWFCTVEGLSIFDGERFANYGAAQGLPHRLVNDLLEAGDGSYWLATYAGLYRFRPRAVRPPSFEKVSLTGGQADPRPTVLLRSRSGEFWCGTTAGLYHIKAGSRLEGVAVPLAPAVNRFPEINALEEDNDGSLWIGTSQGLVRLRPDGSSSFRSLMDRGGVPFYGVETLLLDRDGSLWIGGWGGISRLDLRSDPPAVRSFSPRIGQRLGKVQSLYQDREGDLWIGARGLARLPAGAGLSDGQLQFFDGDPVLSHNDIFALSGDSEGSVWAAVSNLGVLQILRSGFSKYTQADGLESTAVLSVFESHDGTLYAVTGTRHTLNQFEQGRFTPIQPYIPASIHDLGWGEVSVTLQDRKGRWWVASVNGLLRYPKVGRLADLAHTPPDVIYKLPDGLTSEAITRLFEDREGNIWIGCAEGVSRWSAESERLENLTAAITAALGRPPAPLSFAQDMIGQVWMGFFPGGLVRYRASGPERVDEALLAGSINGLVADGAGRLWVASAQGGLGRIDSPGADRPAVRRYTDANGLRSNHLFALAEDRASRIYIAGGQGVDWLDTNTGAVHHFAAGSGLPPGEVQRLYADRQGGIWFASHFGLSRYLPRTGATNAPPPPDIREVRVSGSPVLVSDEGEREVGGLIFGAGKDSIEIAYGAVDFSVGNRVRYRYRLLPVEAEWRQPEMTRSAHYAGIGPGAYRFEVQAVGVDGAVNSETASVAFHIDWPFWKTWWFLLFAGSFAVCLALGAHFYRVRHLVELERVRTRLAADLHDDLGAGLSQMAILSEVIGRRAAAGDAPLVQHHATKIATIARELVDSMSDIVWAINPSKEKPADLEQRMREFAGEMLVPRNIALDFEASAATENLLLSIEARREILLIFKEAIHNVARHSGCTEARVRLETRHGLLRLDVQDNGRGLDAEPLPGNGLGNMRRRAEAVHASLEVHSGAGVGTTVSLSVPLRT
jgi:ligand-binding sensor domain-containing protein